MKLELSEAQKSRLASFTGAARTIDDFVAVEMFGTASAAETIAPAEQALIARYSMPADGPAPITNGQPTVLRMAAWMCHEGVNTNGLGFVREELPASAAKVSPQNPLLIDFNHAAIKGGSHPVIGVWTKAAYAFDTDPQVQKYGLLVNGVMFAWLFPEVAAAMLADQKANGKLRFSMACLADYEYVPAFAGVTAAAGKQIQVAHNPVFFTNSLLDVAPGDPAATGNAGPVGQPLPLDGPVGSPRLDADPDSRRNLVDDPEDPLPLSGPNGVPAVNAEQLATHVKTLVDAHLATFGLPNRQLPINEIPGPSPQEKQAMTDLEQRIADLQPKLAERDATIAQQTATIAMLTEQVQNLGALKATAEDLALTKQALEGQYAQVLAERDAAVAENATLKTAIAAFETEKAAVEQATKLAARIAELPETIRLAHAKRPDAVRTRIEAVWAAKSDEDWTFYKAEELSLAPAPAPAGSYRAASIAAGGALPVATGDDESENKLLTALAQVRKTK